MIPAGLAGQMAFELDAEAAGKQRTARRIDW